MPLKLNCIKLSIDLLATNELPKMLKVLRLGMAAWLRCSKPSAVRKLSTWIITKILLRESVCKLGKLAFTIFLISTFSIVQTSKINVRNCFTTSLLQNVLDIYWLNVVVFNLRDCKLFFMFLWFSNRSNASEHINPSIIYS